MKTRRRLNNMEDRKMTDDEIAQMMLEECLHNAGIIEKSPFDDEEDDSK